MATPVVSTDASSNVNAAVLNKYLNAGKLNVKVNYFELLFTASTNAVTVTGADSDGEVVSGDLTWNAGSVRIDVTLSGFSVAPVILAAISTNTSTNVEKVAASGLSGTSAIIEFLSNATPGVKVDPDGDMQVNVIIIGA